MRKTVHDCHSFGDFITLETWDESSADLLACQIKDTIKALLHDGAIEFPIALGWMASELSKEVREGAGQYLREQQEWKHI